MKRRKGGTYTISAVAAQYEIHPQTLRLYEREGLLKPSRPTGTRIVTPKRDARLGNLRWKNVCKAGVTRDDDSDRLLR